MKSEKSAEKQTTTSKMTPIAIIGMASLFPQARNLAEYWENILAKIDAIVDVPASRWDVNDYYDPNPTAPDKSYCKRGGFLPDVEFDPGEFGLPPNLLEITDVSQLLSLVVARDCLEDAGYGEGREFDRDMTGVVLGMVGIGSKIFAPLMARLQYPVWEKVLRTYGIPESDIKAITEKIKLAYPQWEENSFPGAIGNVVAGRIANRFDLGGTNCTVDAACGTSLAALKVAIAELTSGNADMMISGGVDTDNSIGTYLCFSKTPAFSKGQSLRAFDKNADGMLAGEGIGMFVLKRLADAERDGDRIYAVIKGVGSSSDGRFKSIYAPRPSGQAKAVRRAYAMAGFDPKTVGLVEAHGTGTMAGDPVEFQGLMEVFGVENPDKQYIALGSVKSQIGHTKGAAGAAAMIKAVLALHHKVLPATINVTEPNPKLNIQDSPFYLNTEIRPWVQPQGHPRRAGVSSFGFGGTNFHVALEEYTPEHSVPYRVNRAAQVVVLSAATPADLANVCQGWLGKLNGAGQLNEYKNLLAEVKSSTPQAAHARVGFVAENAAEAAKQLAAALDLVKGAGNQEAAESPLGVYYRKSGMYVKGSLVALFPGQGSQYVDMGRELAVNFPTVRQTVAQMDAGRVADGLAPLSAAIYPVPVFDAASKDKQTELLTRTENAQPAIGTLSAATYRLFQKAGFQPSFTAGHSFGELTALWAAGVYDDEAFFALTRARGAAMAPPADPNFDAGTMLAVKGDVAKLQDELKAFPEITLANFNSNDQVVLAGSKPAIAAVQKALGEKGFSVIPLTVSAAFHTSLVGHAQKPFAEAIKKVKFAKPAVRVFSNSTGAEHPADPEAIRKSLSEHILNPVKFKDEVEAIYAAGGTVFVEFGPKGVLTGLVKNILAGKPHLALAVNGNPKKNSDRQYREAVAQLIVAGLDLKDYDPFILPEKTTVEKKKSAITLQLGAGLYLSDKTKKAFEAAITQKNTLSNALPAASAPAAVSTAPAAVAAPTAPTPAASPAVLSRGIDQLQALQSETLKAHTQFLGNDAEYAKIFAQLTAQELSMLANSQNPAAMEQVNTALQTLDRSMSQFHQHQNESLQVQSQYLRGQTELMQTLVHLTGGVSGVATSVASSAPTQQVVSASNNGNGHKPTESLVVAASAASSAPASLDASRGAAPEAPSSPAKGLTLPLQGDSSTSSADLTAALLQIVSEKTGYPTEMLEMGMDMEADLGIDSIKRVEILGAMQERFPALPKVDAAALSDMRTLGQIAEALAASAPAAAPAPSNPAAQTAPAAAPASGSLSAETLTRAVLEIVSEKTGYPTEMLDLGMDMEADLGIDSIKRVEIMGAMQTRFPELPKADAAALSDMRTLGQIVTALGSGTTNGTPAPANMPASPAQEGLTSSLQGAAAASTLSADAIKAALLEIVSEKTGYPVEMLELGMDMEADLGIDSIKRVEIMGAMQARFPELPKADAAALAEMRTLGQITEYLAGAQDKKEALPFELGESTKGGRLAPPQAPAPVEPALPRGVVALKALPAPDQLSADVAPGRVTLLLDGGDDLTTALAQALSARGHKPVVLSLPKNLVAKQARLPKGVERVDLADLSEEGLQAAVAGLQASHGSAAVFVHLDPLAASAETEKEIVKTSFLLAKFLKESLTASAQAGYAAFMAVTRLDGELGLASSGAVEPLSGGLYGLVKTLNLEWDTVFCRAVDLHPSFDAKTAAGLVLAEMYDPNRLVAEVSHNPRGRFTLAIAEVMEA